MTRRPAKDALMQQLIANGVLHIFGNPGSTELGLMDALHDYPEVDYVLALHEGAAVGMADGYARATGRPAFVNVHITPGLANALSIIFDAKQGGTPLVITAGQQDRRFVLQEPVLAGDLVKLAEPVTKWAAEVPRGADVPMMVQRAFKVALDPPAGPVFLSLPMDALDDEVEGEIEPTTYTARRVRPDRAAAEEAARLLTAARRPVIVCGDRVAASGAQAEVLALAEQVGAEIYTAEQNELNVPTTAPLYLGSAGLLATAHSPVFQDADVLLAVGANVFSQVFYTDRSWLGPETKLIHLDPNVWEIGKNHRPEMGLLADPKAGLADLGELVAAVQTPDQRATAAERRDSIAERHRAQRRAAEASARKVWDARPIAVPRLMSELRDALPPGAIVCDEAITSSGALHRYLDFTEPGSIFAARGGGLGPGLPSAIGVQLARPDRPVVAVVGDGAALYTIQSLWTAAHYRLPVRFVICANRGYRVLKLNMMRYVGFEGRPMPATDFNDPPIDFAGLAQSLGVAGRRVEEPGDIRSALDWAFQQPGPALVEVVIDATIRRVP